MNSLIDEFVNDPLPMFDSVFDEPLIVLFVSVTLLVSATKSSSDNALLNCVVVPVKVISPKAIVNVFAFELIVLFERVAVLISEIIVPEISVEPSPIAL